MSVSGRLRVWLALGWARVENSVPVMMKESAGHHPTDSVRQKGQV